MWAILIIIQKCLILAIIFLSFSCEPTDQDYSEGIVKIKNISSHDVLFNRIGNSNNRNGIVYRIKKNDSLSYKWYSSGMSGDEPWITCVKIFFNDSCYIGYKSGGFIRDSVQTNAPNDFFYIKYVDGGVSTYFITAKDYEYWLENKICE